MEKTENEYYSILIVDDVPKNIQLVAKILTNAGYKLYFAQSGDVALRQLDEHEFDLVLLDIMMPGMDGFEVCEAINRTLPVIFLTAKTDDVSIARGFEVGGVDYVTKPFNSSELAARVKNHLQLRKHEREQVELNKTKDTLLSIISHDLKTPFFNIMGLGELLLENFAEYDDNMKKELITNMVDAARSSHSLLDNLLGWIRMQTGKISYSPRDIKLRSTVDHLLELLNQQYSNKEIEVQNSVDSGYTVFADLNMLNTILRNLLSNAIKYTPRGGEIVIDAVAEPQYLTIRVKDTGIGIDPQKLEKLFSSVKPESIPGTEEEQGSGYGLMITRDFVEMNKGKISVESELNKGAIFIVKLPAGKSQ